MSKFMFVICGAPRSRTTFLFDALLKHPHITGSLVGDMRTNESPMLMHSMFLNNDYLGLEKLHAHWCKGAEDVLAVKAPGYVFAEKFFMDNPLGLTPVFLAATRPIEELITENLNYPDGLEHLKRDLQLTDCPVERRSIYEAVWKSGTLAERAYTRCLWHLDALPALSAIHIGAADYRRPAALATRLCSLVGLATAADVTAHFKTFSLTKLEAGPIRIAEEAIASVNAKMAGADQ